MSKPIRGPMAGVPHGAVVSDAERKAEMEKLLKMAKPGDAAVFAPEQGVVLFRGRGQLDIQPVVVAVPLASLFDLLGGMLQSVVAPTFANVKLTVDTPPEGKS